MNYSIKINNVTKEYKLYKDDKDRFKDLFFGKRYTPYRALDKLNITLPEGEVIGILGKNGSGKSTLLKMVTGVTFPTEGSLEVNGTVSALLELTAGFDGELTGRENIYLKGYGLGLEKDYIDKKMQAIIDFAEIGEYMDQPVRMYSSGMKSRLGFAISINIDPDILVVDEVLAVGDEIFRKKCMDKMNEFKNSGKTILFVSHSIGQIKSFCTKGIWLHKGKMLFYDNIDRVARLYEQYLKGIEVDEILENIAYYDNMVEIKQSLLEVEIEESKTILHGYVTIDRNYSMEIAHIELKGENESVIIKPKEQFEVEANKKTYTIEINNEDLPLGKYQTYIHLNVAGNDHSRQIWCVNKSSKFLDATNNTKLDIDKNRLIITKS
ncbi:MAG: ABC transporter ATP-binding protein [Peptostreptococcaceae bacterium]